MKTVLTYGTFDLFHIGHLRLLERARALGDRLIVAISSDEFNAVKGKKATVSYADRAAIVAALRCVDAVIPEVDWSQKPKDIQKFQAAVFVMGDDWFGKFDDLRVYCDVVYLQRTPEVSTTQLRGWIVNSETKNGMPALVR